MKGMTGYGEFSGEIADSSFIITLKSLNSRFFEYKLNAPRMFHELESEIIRIIKRVVKRGKLFINIDFLDPEMLNSIELNTPLLEKYLEILDQLKKDYKITGKIRGEQVLIQITIITLWK